MPNTLLDILGLPHVRKFIQDHIHDDPVQLILQSKKYSELPIKEIVGQIKARVKARTKLPEFFENQEVIFPEGISLEQSSSEQTAKYKASLMTGKTLTDLTGGFGIDLYYCAQGFESSNYVEQNTDLADLVAHNYQKLQSKSSIHATTAESYLASELSPADVYYLDPARRGDENERVFRIEDCIPDLNLILPSLLARKAEVWVKLAPLLDISQALEQMPQAKEVYVISVKNECKELLFRLLPDYKGDSKRIAINLLKDQVETFEFCEADQISPTYSLPLDYLYEPNASIMKAGGFNAIARVFGLKKLHQNSHLYTSAELVPDFPGRTFLIQAVTVLNKKKLKPILPQMKANITVRNYPQSVKEIRLKTGIKEGGNTYLFATTLMDGSAKVLMCAKQ